MMRDVLTIVMIAIAAIVLAPLALSFAFHFLSVLCTICCQFIEACVRGVAWLARLPGRLIRCGWRKMAR